uniref:Uncharacterized protein n=1 Tax=Aegilops tauschii subsp. strangulata TaxID=200361 RepID=A0A453NDA5_AEGTS
MLYSWWLQAKASDKQSREKCRICYIVVERLFLTCSCPPQYLHNKTIQAAAYSPPAVAPAACPRQRPPCNVTQHNTSLSASSSSASCSSSPSPHRHVRRHRRAQASEPRAIAKPHTPPQFTVKFERLQSSNNGRRASQSMVHNSVPVEPGGRKTQADVSIRQSTCDKVKRMEETKDRPPRHRLTETQMIPPDHAHLSV